MVSLTRAGDGWAVATPGGTVTAERVVLATNGYTGGLWPGLARSVVPVFSAIVASAPLPPALAETILDGRGVLYELGEVTTYYRVDGSRRLLVGGRSRSRNLAGPAAFPFLSDYACRLWPAMRGVAWTHGWNGQLAITPDHLPHWHAPAEGVLACLGYNGRGVAMATVMGREVARHLRGAAPLIPFTPIRPIAMHGLWKLGVAARLAYGRARDRLAQTAPRSAAPAASGHNGSAAINNAASNSSAPVQGPPDAASPAAPAPNTSAGTLNGSTSNGSSTPPRRAPATTAAPSVPSNDSVGVPSSSPANSTGSARAG